MKRTIFTIAALTIAICSMAQITLWRTGKSVIYYDNGNISKDTIYSFPIAVYDYDEIDSITFTRPRIVDDTPAGYVTIIIKIPEGSECNGIAFKGTIDGANWTYADQYLSADGEIVGRDEAALFEKIKNSDWWKLTIKVSEPFESYTESYSSEETYLRGKICLLYEYDYAWQGQATSWEVDDVYSTAKYGRSGDESLMVNSNKGTVAVVINSWQNSECVKYTFENVTFNLHTTIPVSNDGVVYIVGNNFENEWDPASYPMTKIDDYNWTITMPVKRYPSDTYIYNPNEGVYKYVVNGSWGNDGCVLDSENSQICPKRMNNITIESTTQNDEVYGFLNYGVDEICY